MDSPPSSTIPEKFSDQKILKITNKITALLTGEVPVRCQDVTVYFSMEEWQYLEGNKEFYNDVIMENQLPLASTEPRSMAGLGQSLSWDCAAEDHDMVITVKTWSYLSTDEEILTNHLENFTKVTPSYTEHSLYLDNCSSTDLRYTKFANSEGSNLLLKQIKAVFLDHTYALTYAKAKSLLYKTADKPNTDVCNSSNPPPQVDSVIKQESLTSLEGNLSCSNTYTCTDSNSVDCTRLSIKGDPSLDEEQAPDTGFCKTEEHSLYQSIAVKEEPKSPHKHQPNFTIYTFSDPGQETPGNIKEEPISYEIEVPVEMELFADGTLYPSSQPKKNIKSKNKQQLAKRPYPCKECGKLFKQKSGLGMHKKTHLKDRIYACPDCCKCFISQSSLTAHQKCHTKERSYSCPECGKCFSKQVNLINHQSIHATKNPFSCPKCGKQFISNANLCRHKEKHCTDVTTNELTCLKCGKEFADRPSFLRHQRYHGGEKPFSCPECGKRFIKRINLIKHQRLHTRKNLHGCQECGRYFMSSAYLVRHMKSHATKRRPWSCQVCGKYFLSKIDLTTHLRIHKGDKSSSPSEWRKSFIRKLGFVIRERSNVGEEPYLCSECGETFEKKLELIRHQKIHTGEKSEPL
ncbi:zinc finger protein 436-like isoform X2 [Hyperolius riggenbachi]